MELDEDSRLPAVGRRACARHIIQTRAGDTICTHTLRQAAAPTQLRLPRVHVRHRGALQQMCSWQVRLAEDILRHARQRRRASESSKKRHNGSTSATVTKFLQSKKMVLTISLLGRATFVSGEQPKCSTRPCQGPADITLDAPWIEQVGLTAAN